MTSPTPLALADVDVTDRVGALASWMGTDGQLLLLKDVVLRQDELDVVAAALDRVSFKDATFDGPISFADIVVPGLILSFVRNTFSGSVDFANVQLEPTSQLKFSTCEFQASVSFTETNLDARALHFVSTKFHAEVDFNGLGMAQHTRFERSTFHAPVLMNRIRYGSKLTQFIDCGFDGLVELSDSQIPHEAKVQFTRCTFSQRVVINAAQGPGSIAVEECEPVGVLDDLVTAGGPGSYDPPRDGLEFRFLEGTHCFWIANEHSLVWLLKSIDPVQIVLGREGDPFGYEVVVSVADGRFELRELSGTAVLPIEPGSEHLLLHEALSYRTVPAQDLKA